MITMTMNCNWQAWTCMPALYANNDDDDDDNDDDNDDHDSEM